MTVPAPAANPCTVCGVNEAYLSVMRLADYDQQKFCPWCGPDALRAIAEGTEQALREAGFAETVEGIAGLAAEQPSEDETADGTPPPPAEAAPPARPRKTRARGQERET